MRVSLASQGCESENVARFHKVAANIEKNLEGQERKRSHLSGVGVDAVDSMAWINYLGF